MLNDGTSRRAKTIGNLSSRSVDLLVMRAKEDDQMAMHGMAHPLAVAAFCSRVMNTFTTFLAASSHSVNPGITFLDTSSEIELRST